MSLMCLRKTGGHGGWKTMRWAWGTWWDRRDRKEEEPVGPAEPGIVFNNLYLISHQSSWLLGWNMHGNTGSINDNVICCTPCCVSSILVHSKSFLGVCQWMNDVKAKILLCEAHLSVPYCPRYVETLREKASWQGYLPLLLQWVRGYRDIKENGFWSLHDAKVIHIFVWALLQPLYL